MPGGLFCAIGNPLNDGTWTYTWQNGRQLARMQSVDTDASFVYNENGLRVQKTVNGVVTNYTLHGKNVVHMKRGNDDCTSHHEHNDDCDDSDCTIDDLYAPKDNHEIKYRLDINISTLDYFIISSVNLSLNDILKNKGSDFRREIVALIFQNPHVNSIFGLRAPPIS